MKWLATTEYIDIDTGELTRKKPKDRKITILKTTKKTEYDKRTETGYIRYTNEYRRHPQYEINFPSE